MAHQQLEKTASHRCFGGEVQYFTHDSKACASTMRFAVYLPPQAKDGPLPVLYWLSGLTCNEENFIVKAGAQRYAAENGLILVAPDTSPRGLNLPGEDASWDLGTGAGFYVNATQPPWSGHYHMDSYITAELPECIEKHFPVQADKRGVSGHSMGGHGALVLALRNPGLYKSVSAFAPICAPTACPWGEKAFTAYLGEDQNAWQAYDACALLDKAESTPPLLVDQGGADPFLEEQLKPEQLQTVCKEKGFSLNYRLHPGYDHGYFFVASFIGDHIRHHHRALTRG